MARKFGLGLRMENIEGATAVENYDPEESLVVQDEAAAAVSEADMVGEGVNTITEEIDDSQEAAEELVGEVIPAMQEAAADDGMSPREAEHVQARLESICKRAGIDFKSTGLVMRRENFTGTASRKAQTQMRLEAAKGVFAKIWENIKKAWEWLKDQFAGIMSKWSGSAEAVKKRLTDIQTRLTAMKGGSSAKDSSISNGAKRISIEGKASVFPFTSSTLALVIKDTEFFHKSIKPLQAEINKINVDTFMTAAVKGSADGITEINDVFENLCNVVVADFGADRVTGVLKEYTGRDNTKQENGEDPLGVWGNLAGGKAVVFYQASSASGSNVVKTFKVSVETVEDRFADKYEAPKSASDITPIISKGLELCTSLIALEKQKAVVDEVTKSVLSKFDSIIKQVQAKQDLRAGVTDEDGTNTKTEEINRTALLVQASGNVRKLVELVVLKSPKMLFDCAALCADIASASVNNLEEPKS